MPDNTSIPSISLIELMRLAIARGNDIKDKERVQLPGGASEDPRSTVDDEISALLEPLKASLEAQGSADFSVLEGLMEPVWRIGDRIKQGEDLNLRDVLTELDKELRGLSITVDNALVGVLTDDPFAIPTQTRYEQESRQEMNRPEPEQAAAPPPPPAPPSADPDKPTYKLYPMLAIAAAAGHKEGLGKKGFSRATSPSKILADSTLEEQIEKIQADYPGLNGSLLTQTCETVIKRAQAAGKKDKDFIVDLALSEREIAHLEKNAFSFQNAFPEIATELSHLSNAVKSKERGQKMAMPTQEGMNPAVYNSHAERDQALAQKRTADAAARAAANPPPPPVPPSDPAPSDSSAERVDSPAPEPEQEDSGKWVKRTAAGAAAAAAVVSIGAGIKEQNDQNQNAQDPNGQQQESRTRFGAGAKFALGAALALGALLIAKPELVGLGGGAGRSR